MSRNGSAVPPLDDVALMQLADGELDEAEAAEVEAAVERDPAARTKLAALAEIGESVRGHLELEADAVEARLDALWSKVEAGIAAPAPARSAGATAVRPPAVVEPMRQAESARPRTPAAEAPPGFFGWLGAARGYLATGALTAAAAAIFFLVLRPPREVVVERLVQVPPTPTAVQPAALRASPPEVEQLEVSGGTGTVFTIPDDDGEGATAVIWLTPDDTEGPL